MTKGMEVPVLLLEIVWTIRILLNIVSYAHLWWVKEYRWDRMMVHLRTPQGKHFWWPQRRRPPISPKSLLLLLSTFGCFGYILWYIDGSIFFRLALADALSFPITWIIVFLLNIPTKIYHRILIAIAVRKLRRHMPMTVIGITGSYGKTTTKEYLATILSANYSVLKTQMSKNSPIGIAEVILKDLKPEHEVFVVEMGAYKRGEIAQMAEMVRPQIGIITAINPQHQDLFGSVETTMKAKYELLSGLTGKKIAVMNTEDPRVQIMAQWAKRDGCDVWDQRITASGITAGFDGVTFTCCFGKEKRPVKAPVLGVHQAGNIVTAIAGAVAAGMKFPEAVKAAYTIVPTSKSLSVQPGIHGSRYINDTFNNNPDSAIAALNVLSWVKGKKFLVFQPMIELGTFAGESHASVGGYAASICDEIILTNHNFYDDFMKGVRRCSKAVSVLVLSSENAAAVIRDKVGKEDAVLFKGKEAEHVLQAI